MREGAWRTAALRRGPAGGSDEEKELSLAAARRGGIAETGLRGSKDAELPRFKLQFVDSLVKRVSRGVAPTDTCDAARWGNLRYNLGGSL